eukprot:TRINITY_DN27508_c0_g1_i1.p2 TRINITY_DN27508_c0_g1~~TRINITY_DN27508_c0_g1_i1.p2  ORF type:complete len:107 (+),score=15.55 TRINITY_DN27508_c0_g1_i1:365-685(+)
MELVPALLGITSEIAHVSVQLIIAEPNLGYYNPFAQAMGCVSAQTNGPAAAAQYVRMPFGGLVVTANVSVTTTAAATSSLAIALATKMALTDTLEVPIATAVLRAT